MEEVANAFNDLAGTVNSRRPVSVKQFAEACSKFSGVFEFLEASTFKFAQMDYVEKVKDLTKASRSISTLEEMVDKDIAVDKPRSKCRVEKVNSHTRNLLKIKRGLDLIKVFAQEIVASEGDSSLKTSARKAYNEVLYRYHGYSIQQACATALDSLPSRSLVLLLIGETEESVQTHLQSYIAASTPVIAYIDGLFISKDLGIEW